MNLKKTLLSLLLIISSLNAEVIEDHYTTTFEGHYNNGQNTFILGNSHAVCLNNVIYYTLGEGRSRVMSQSHNPISTKPYYCEILSIVESEEQNWATRATNYIQTIAVYHSFDSVKSYKGQI